MAGRTLLVIDLQNDYFPGGRMPLTHVDTALDKAVAVIAKARADGTPVVHVRHEFPVGAAPFFEAGSPGADIHPAVAPVEGEAVVLKHHANAFRETELHAVLEGHAPDELVIVGAMSHMCIDATARAAADAGHIVTILHDACATTDLAFGDTAVPAAHVHAAFMAALATGYAQLRSVDEHLAA